MEANQVEVKISEIAVNNRKRKINSDKVRELAESIKQVGLLQPVVINESNRLIAGWHRLEACKALKWESIPCRKLTGLSALDTELAEIDENLVRNELTVLERAEHLKRRKEIYEAKYPEAKAEERRKLGLKQNIEKNVLTSKNYENRGEIVSPREDIPLSFSEDTATKLGVSPRTVQQEVQIAEKIAPDVKEIIADTELADSKKDLLKLARMEPETQKKVAEKIAVGEAKSIVDARRLLKRESVKKTPELNGKYRVIYADPPWCYNDKRDGKTTGAEDHYPSMTIEELCALPVKEIAEENAVLFLWVTSPLLEECFQVIKAWGFKYKASFVWDKVKHNMGHYNSVRHEFLLVCTRGSCLPDVPTLYDSVVTVERSEKHSEKPEEFRKIIDTLYPYGRRIELFARKAAPGWEVWGNEV